MGILRSLGIYSTYRLMFLSNTDRRFLCTILGTNHYKFFVKHSSLYMCIIRWCYIVSILGPPATRRIRQTHEWLSSDLTFSIYDFKLLAPHARGHRRIDGHQRKQKVHIEIWAEWTNENIPEDYKNLPPRQRNYSLFRLQFRIHALSTMNQSKLPKSFKAGEWSICA